MLQRLSRESFRWVTRHPTRWWEYPWIHREIQRRLPGRIPWIADVGAGRSPLPIAFSRLDLTCTVIDPDIQSRLGLWVGEEWEKTDYTRWGIRSQGVGMHEMIFRADSLGFITCVSVFEHVTAETRRGGLARMAAALESGGVALFTVDLTPGTRDLYNIVLGQPVEELSLHGTLDDLIAEARALGLVLETETRCPLSDGFLEIVALIFVKG